PILAIVLAIVANANALDLTEAWRSVPARPDAITTRLELITAESALLRVESDPLALRLDRLRATQEVELLRAQHRHALLTALQQIAEAYTSVLQAREQVALAQAGLELAEAGLEVARIRFANGGATSLEVRDAEIGVDEARQGVEAARSGLDVARANLEGMIGAEVDPAELEPETVDLLVALPALEEFVARLGEHPTLLQASHGVALARARLELLDPAYAPLAQIELEPVPDDLLVALPALEEVVARLGEHPTLLQASHGVALDRAGVELLDPAYAPLAQIESARTQLATAEELVAEALRGFYLRARNADRKTHV